jgi:3-isopropylmalate/(R)-2-methylmalate dehydratase small subunit
MTRGVPLPDFVLHKPPHASEDSHRGEFRLRLIARACALGLLDFGIRCIIAPSFADIFYNNCFKNGILPIALPQADVDKLMDDAERGSNAIVTVDLETQEITGPDGGRIKFEVDAFRKHCLLNGLDDIGLTLQKAAAIENFEARDRSSQSWLWR